MVRTVLSLGLELTLLRDRVVPRQTNWTRDGRDFFLRVHRHAPPTRSYYIALFDAAPLSREPGAVAGVYGCGAIFAPGESASWPVTTTVSSGFTPFSMTVRSPSWR